MPWRRPLWRVRVDPQMRQTDRGQHPTLEDCKKACVPCVEIAPGVCMPFASDGDVMKHTPAINDTVSTARCVSFGRATAVCARRLVVHVVGWTCGLAGEEGVPGTPTRVLLGYC